MEYAVAKPKVIDTFDKLDVWQAARILTKQIYEITRDFPKDEQFGLTNQMRRAASSICANIAEGFSRQTIPDKLHFYGMAQGSLTEVQSFIIIANDVQYLNDESKLSLYAQSIKTHKLLTGFIKSTKRRTT